MVETDLTGIVHTNKASALEEDTQPMAPLSADLQEVEEQEMSTGFVMPKPDQFGLTEFSRDEFAFFRVVEKIVMNANSQAMLYKDLDSLTKDPRAKRLNNLQTYLRDLCNKLRVKPPTARIR